MTQFKSVTMSRMERVEPTPTLHINPQGAVLMTSWLTTSMVSSKKGYSSKSSCAALFCISHCLRPDSAIFLDLSDGIKLFPSTTASASVMHCNLVSCGTFIARSPFTTSMSMYLIQGCLLSISSMTRFLSIILRTLSFLFAMRFEVYQIGRNPSNFTFFPVISSSLVRRGYMRFSPNSLPNFLFSRIESRRADCKKYSWMPLTVSAKACVISILIAFGSGVIDSSNAPTFVTNFNKVSFSPTKSS
mmetsp:Transcript_15915/g.29782  ORF Transcript_15915/g.29782 Transcript_15915/m.29782 type:complete len:245 (+) Transcript_15915:1479-2213(+)